ncbi:MAG: hypothetical protein IJZ03_04320 [Clostridia bacterium]|nr:hypothetical protein [Clostridia bacterium]
MNDNPEKKNSEISENEPVKDPVTEIGKEKDDGDKIQETSETEKGASEPTGSEKKKKSAKPRKRSPKKESVIVKLFSSAVDAFYRNIKTGIFGRFFTSYDSLEKKTEECAAVSLPKRVTSFFRRRREAQMKCTAVHNEETGEQVASIRDPLSKKRSLVSVLVSAFEKSSVIGALKKFCTALLYLPMSTYGGALLALGLTTVLVQAADTLLFFDSLDVSGVIIGVGYALVALMTIFAGDAPLVAYINESKIGNFVFYHVFGVSKEIVDLNKSVPKNRFWAFIIGVVLGLTSAFWPAWIPLCLVGVLVLALGIASNPESGALILVFAFPFVSGYTIGKRIFCVILAYTLASWIIKIIGGRRRVKLGFIEGCCMIFAAFVVLTALVSTDRSQAVLHMTKILCAMLGFFMMSGLLATRIWMDRAIKAFTASAFVVSVIGIYEWIVGSVDAMWKLDKILDLRIMSVFPSSEALAIYLCAAFFFSLPCIHVCKTKRGKLMAALTAFLTIVCTLLTVNTFAVITLLSVFMIYLLVRSRKNVAFVIFFVAILALACTFALDLLPKYIVDTLFDDFRRRYDVLQAALEMAVKYPLSGIGLGSGIFRELGVSITSVHASGIMEGVGMLLDIMIRMGIFGALLFAMFVIVAYQMAFSTIRLGSSHGACRIYMIPALCAFATLTFSATMSSMLNDLSMAFLFWSTVGFMNASRRIVYFENVGSTAGGLDVTLQIKSFRKSELEADSDNSERTDV